MSAVGERSERDGAHAKDEDLAHEVRSLLESRVIVQLGDEDLGREAGAFEQEVGKR